MVAGAAPAPAVIAKMKEIGFELTHVYGLTEVYGPAAVCARQASWDALEDEERALLNARQGVRYHLQAGVSVRDPETMLEVPADSEQTVGEIMFRGNICMKGYLKNERATEDAFAGGWFHRRPGRDDARRLHPHQGPQQDIIISGGENISSIEVEDALYRHPSVAAVAVVAMPDPKWGETPCAFVELKPGCSATAEEIIAHCKLLLPASRCRARCASASCPRPPPARSRNSNCARPWAPPAPSTCPAPPPIPASPPDSNDNHISRSSDAMPYQAPSKTHAVRAQPPGGPARRGGLPGFEEATPDTAQAVLEEAAHFAGEVLAR